MKNEKNKKKNIVSKEMIDETSVVDETLDLEAEKRFEQAEKNLAAKLQNSNTISEEDLSKVKHFSQCVDKIKTELRKDVVGHDEIVDDVIIAIIAGGNVLLEGVPGVGKTRLVRSLGKTLNLPFSRIQFTPDLMPSDVTGTNVIEKDENEKMNIVFQKGPIFANIVLADEINRSTPKTQAAMLEVMQEHKVTINTNTYYMEEPFFVLATENPIEQDGTYPLPEAQMDRFMFKLIMKFPSVDELKDIVNMTQATLDETATSVVNGDEILKMRELAKTVPIVDEVLEYAMNLVSCTHPELEISGEYAKKYLKYGASPRAAQALITAAKVMALIEGNYNVSYANINKLAYPVLRHRIKTNYNAINDHLSVDDVIGLIIKDAKRLSK
ncbi:MAG: AAA family ATPase [Anaeroplasma sp.]